MSVCCCVIRVRVNPLMGAELTAAHYGASLRGLVRVGHTVSSR